MANILHPIQLQGIKVLELVLTSDGSQEDTSGLDLPFQFSVGHSDFDLDKKLIMVGVIGEVGSSDKNSEVPFYIKAHLVGQFTVDTDKFPLEHVSDWASKNAPLILLPFLREHIYGLASRAGIKEVLVPLLIVPTIKITSPKTLDN